MSTEQREYVALINRSNQDEILIKKTGWEEINLFRHSHNKIQIIYTLSGTLHVEIGKVNYFVPERHIAWIPADTEHKLSSNNRQVSLIIFYANLEAAVNTFRKTTFSIYNANTLVAENLQFLSSQGDKINRKLRPDLYWFALSFFNLLPQVNPEADSLLKTLIIPNDARLYPVIEYIRKHVHEPLRLDQLAVHFHFSVRTLSRLFKDSGIHFSGYVNHLRIMKAIELLTEEKKSIQEIAYATGFSTPNSFNRVFKQIVGKSPKAYMRM